MFRLWTREKPAVPLEGTEGADYQFNEGLVRNGGMALRAGTPQEIADKLGEIFDRESSVQPVLVQ
ncbi:MAG TPA: hypothetical protein VFI02_04030 [Armatimonadota bacterium]|nr:hypothetical protein [Armatimonadota bacterium]